MKIKNLIIPTHWSWNEIKEGEVLIISERYTDKILIVLVVDTSYEIFKTLDKADIADKLVVVDLKDNMIYSIEIDKYIILSRFKEPEIILGEKEI